LRATTKKVLKKKKKKNTNWKTGQLYQQELLLLAAWDSWNGPLSDLLRRDQRIWQEKWFPSVRLWTGSGTNSTKSLSRSPNDASRNFIFFPNRRTIMDVRRYQVIGSKINQILFCVAWSPEFGNCKEE
jgi:hypothetical protein